LIRQGLAPKKSKGKEKDRKNETQASGEGDQGEEVIPNGCGEGCINRFALTPPSFQTTTDLTPTRHMLYTCPPSLCPSSALCSNRPLHLLTGYRENHGVETFRTANRGFGIRTTCEIKEGDFVMDYRGEVISLEEGYRRVREVYEGKKEFYLLQYDDWYVKCSEVELVIADRIIYFLVKYSMQA
jgi:hypothetical protein